MEPEMQKLLERALLFSLAVAILGAIFKINHFPYSNELLMSGLGSVALAAFIRYAVEGTLQGYATGFTIALTCLALLFKILHFEYASWLVWSAVVSAVILIIITLFFSKGKADE